MGARNDDPMVLSMRNSVVRITGKDTDPRMVAVNLISKQPGEHEFEMDVGIKVILHELAAAGIETNDEEVLEFVRKDLADAKDAALASYLEMVQGAWRAVTKESSVKQSLRWTLVEFSGVQRVGTVIRFFGRVSKV